MLRRRPHPAHATVREAIEYLASACDGAVRRDGHGFSADDVPIGHHLATCPRWGRRDRRHAQRLVVVYRDQLARAGFDLHGRPRAHVKSRHDKKPTPMWAADPTKVHALRYWNGERWTAYVR